MLLETGITDNAMPRRLLQVRGMLPHKTARGQIALGKMAVSFSSPSVPRCFAVGSHHIAFVVSMSMFRSSRVSLRTSTERSALSFLLP